jgi:hypothetical protein
MQEQSIELIETQTTAAAIDRRPEIGWREIMYDRSGARLHNGALCLGRESVTICSNGFAKRIKPVYRG